MPCVLEQFLAQPGLVRVLRETNAKVKLEAQMRNWRKCMIGRQGRDSEKVEKAFRPGGECDPSEGEEKGKNIRWMEQVSDCSTILGMLCQEWCYGPKLPGKGVQHLASTPPLAYRLHLVIGWQLLLCKDGGSSKRAADGHQLILLPSTDLRRSKSHVFTANTTCQNTDFWTPP